MKQCLRPSGLVQRHPRRSVDRIPTGSAGNASGVGRDMDNGPLMGLIMDIRLDSGLDPPPKKKILWMPDRVISGVQAVLLCRALYNSQSISPSNQESTPSLVLFFIHEGLYNNCVVLTDFYK